LNNPKKRFQNILKNVFTYPYLFFLPYNPTNRDNKNNISGLCVGSASYIAPYKSHGHHIRKPCPMVSRAFQMKKQNSKRIKKTLPDPDRALFHKTNKN
jgi:hypothetical protein